MIILLSRFVTFFVRNICWVNNGNTRPPALCAGEAPDEKVKINELGPNHYQGQGVQVVVACYYSRSQNIFPYACRKIVWAQD